MRAGVTLIELIFIIIILAILGSLAIPRLAATRDDAKIAADVHNMSLCIRDADRHYTATGTDLDISASSACSQVECYAIAQSVNGKNFNVAIKQPPVGFCAQAGELGGHLTGSHQFGGSSVKY
jgi:type II secretory pathway pseudopilin PulG